MVKRNSRRPRVRVTADGEGLAGHAGSRLLADLADAVGLTEALSVAMAPTRQRRSKHDPGRVLVDLAVMLADGGDSLSDLKVLRNQPDLFGEVASDPTAWRVIASINAARRDAIAIARAVARQRAWELGVRPEWIVLDFDATLVTAHSEKEQAAPTWKRGFGFHPLLCFLDGTNEALAGVLRAGNAGSNTVADHIAVLDAAVAQLPVKTKADDPEHGEWMLARADSAGCTHGFVEALRKHGIEFSVGFPIDEATREAVLAVPKKAWKTAMTQDLDEREGAEVAEITHLLDLSAWPEGTRAICRREDPHPGAQLSFTDADGHRFQVFITDSTDPDIVYLEARHRGHARVEDRIRNGKATGLNNFPFCDFAPNQAWLLLVLIACDLVAWAQRLCLDGELASAEPKRLRYCLWHCAGRLARSGRVTRLRLQQNWPWAAELTRAFQRLNTLPLRA